MQAVHFTATHIELLSAVPSAPVQSGFLWVFLARDSLDANLGAVQALAQAHCGEPLMELHVQDLQNAVHPSHYDYTSSYDMVVFRRLTLPGENGDASHTDFKQPELSKHAAKALQPIGSRPVGFVVMDKLLISVHPTGCATAKQFLERFVTGNTSVTGNGNGNGSAAAPALRGTRMPQSPADLMLRMVNVMVDSYLDLRKVLTAQLEQWQGQLLDTGSQFTNWRALLAGRTELHLLEDLCEEQQDAIQEWLDTLQEDMTNGPERDALVARTRDVIEHIARVLHHVRRLEQGAETAVQMHFSVTANRANNVMRTLTALTAIFLPLNLITGLFGMNFKDMPLVNHHDGFWFAVAAMGLVALGIVWVFTQKRYLRSKG
jgi:magnesium transporter